MGKVGADAKADRSRAVARLVFRAGGAVVVLPGAIAVAAADGGDGAGMIDGAGCEAVTLIGGPAGPNRNDCHRTRATPAAMQTSPTNASSTGLRVAAPLPCERPSAMRGN